LAKVVNPNDVLVCDLTREHELALEPPFDVSCRSRIGSRLGANDFNRDGDTQLGIPRLIDRAHSTDAEETEDVVPAAECLAGRQRARLDSSIDVDRRAAG